MFLTRVKVNNKGNDCMMMVQYCINQKDLSLVLKTSEDKTFFDF